MDTYERTLIDVFMPEDLCARCGEEEPLREFSLLAETSPSSLFRSARLSFCSPGCRDQFVVSWKAINTVGVDF